VSKQGQSKATTEVKVCVPTVLAGLTGPLGFSLLSHCDNQVQGPQRCEEQRSQLGHVLSILFFLGSKVMIGRACHY
jgi:hypothetical protein